MTTVFDISMSLDGYVAAAGVRPEEPMGDGGQQLHEWAFGTDERGRDFLAESASTVGATIASRRTYDLSVPWWGPDGARRHSPYPDVHRLSRHARSRTRGKRVHIREQSRRGPRAGIGRRR